LLFFRWEWVDCAVFRNHKRQRYGKRHGNNQLGQTRCSSAGGCVGEQEPTAERVCHAFEDAPNGRSIKRGADNNGKMMEGKLVDSRGQEAEASMQQPASKQ
jgi:hypothetical protein